MAKDKSRTKEDKRESGLPGGGAGRREEVGGSGVYPMSGPHPKGEAPVVSEAEWGQGRRAAVTPPKQCQDIMTRDPICCTKSSTVQEAARLMRDQNIGLVPIAENLENKRLIGVVTDRDLVLRVVAENRGSKTRVEEVMTRDLATCLPEDSIQKCLDTMESHQVRRIPVVDNNQRIVGIIAQADIALRMRKRDKTAEVVREISKPKVMGGAGD